MAGRHLRPQPPGRVLPWGTAAVGVVLLIGSLLQLVPILEPRRDAAALSSSSPADPYGFEAAGTAGEEFVVEEPAITPAGRGEPLLARKQSANTVRSTQERSESQAAAHRKKPVAKPASVSIPSVGVESRLIRLGLNPDKTLQVPRSYSLAGWYTKGAAPGEVGPAVIVGHYDSVDGPAVFYRLKDLRPGQTVQVRRADGSNVKFAVDRVKRFGKNDFPTNEVYGSVDRPELRLITCGGSFDYRTRHYRDNLVVFAHLV